MIQDKDKSGATNTLNGLSTEGLTIMASMDKKEASCAQPWPEVDPGRIYDRPGYRLMGYVDGFIQAGEVPVPRVRTVLTREDRVATGLVRCGINRYRYTVVPGLYAVGNPDVSSEVLVTANFKLTFDHLRKELSGINAWILVLDTRGINVWCAAGKGTFATRELVSRIQAVGLDKVVDHRRLIVPQLGATGVSAGEVKSLSGFRVVYGPIRAHDIRAFLNNKQKADPAMREVTFNLYERLILTPVEFQMALKPALITAVVLFVLSGLGPGYFSLSHAWPRWLTTLAALGLGIVAGAVVTPVLLPFIPVREFALKGTIAGTIAALALLAFLPGATVSVAAGLSVFLFVVTVSSFLAMNFTGATPFTAPSGVEKEMKRYIPFQLAALLVSTGTWIYSAF
ncbi:MAG: mercury methylation corrinoid protein HgcA [Pseudomonadota bacterium]